MNRPTLKLFILFCFLIVQTTFAQTIVTGIITDSKDGSLLPGVNVIEKGTTNGVVTDFDGKYTIKLSSSESVLQFSFIGYSPQEINVNGRKVINVTLEESEEQLDAVIVTALGIKREEKSLGFAAQELKGSEILEAREPNIANSLSGKASGVQIIKSSNGPAGSSKIVIRGNNSLTGNNQPLIVVDGIPMENGGGATNNDFFNPGEDLGNGLSDINADDIESMTILKGASASALYGTRAGNGVILITTKTGRGNKGLGINYSATLGLQTIFITPELQNSFGQGSDGIFDENSGSSWGAPIGETVTLGNGNSSVLRAHDNIGNYYNSGITKTHSLSFQQQVTNKTSLYSSLSYLDDESNIPGATYERLNLTLRGLSRFGENESWTLDTKIQHINTTANNRPINGNRSLNSYGLIAGLPRSINILDYSDHSDVDGNIRWFGEGQPLNPYWLQEFNLNEDQRNRFLLSASLKHQFNDWFSAEIKAGSDIYTTVREKKLYVGSPFGPDGDYSLSSLSFKEDNYSALLVANKDDLFGKLGATFSLGGNLMTQKRKGLNSSVDGLEVPNLFSLNNSAGNVRVGQTFSEKKINSIYGLLQLNYDGYLFLDITGRNDWSSTLHANNRSFFYPSVSTSFVVTDFLRKSNIEMPDWMGYAKLRASFAEVGNDLDPYQLYNTYDIGQDANGNTTATTNNVLLDPNIKSELIQSFEIGFETKLFNNRLGLDFTYYKTNATNQILDLAMDPFSGYNFRKINAGDIQNKGFELSLNAFPIRNENFSWGLTVNYSQNDNTIEELIDGVSQYTLGAYDDLLILAEVGQSYGVLYGTSFLRVEDENDPNFGKIIVNSDGTPERDSERKILGSQQPDALLGISNTLTYKGLTLNFLVDSSIGGEIFSGTNRALQLNGNAAATVVNGAREEFVVDAVVPDGNGGYVTNTTPVSHENYWGAVAGVGNLGIAEANVYDATTIRLRRVSLDYKIPTNWIENTPFQSLKFGVSANNVWMIKSNLNGVDPESVFATGTNATGFEYLSSPTSRTVLFNLVASF